MSWFKWLLIVLFLVEIGYRFGNIGQERTIITDEVAWAMAIIDGLIVWGIVVYCK